MDSPVLINIKAKHVYAFGPFWGFEGWPDLGWKFGLCGFDLGGSGADPKFWAGDLGKKGSFERAPLPIEGCPGPDHRFWVN